MADGRSFSEVSEDSIDPDDALSVHPCLPGLSAKLVSSSSLTGAARDGKPVKQRRKASLFTNFMKAEREMRNVEEELPQDMDLFVDEIRRRAKQENEQYEAVYKYTATHADRGCMRILSPLSERKKRWDWVVALAIIVHVVATPVLCGFSERLTTIAAPVELKLRDC